MATKLSKDLQRKRRLPDPRSIKKHSDIVRRRVQNDVGVIHGEREKTDTGFIVKGFFGKNFETFIQVMMEGTSTPVMKHEKKDRTVRVLSGMLAVATDKHSVLLRGQELALERGTEYRLLAPKGDVEFLVVQSANYAATLEVVDASEAVTTDISAETLGAYKAAPASQPTQRRGSKAKQQLAARAADRRTQGKELQLGKSPSQGPSSATAAPVMNPQPSMGNFDDSSAG